MRCALITDSHVEILYGKQLEENLKREGVDLFCLSIPPGEVHKTRATKEEIEDVMAARKMGRDSLIIALGGGVVTDLAGFIAATYCRGIPFISIPTTLLAMIDASIGGKTAINLPEGKNLIGAFYSPSCVFINPEFLSTLPEKEWKNGYAEMIKYSLVYSRSFFQRLEKKQFCEGDIYRSIRIKETITRRDPLETGLRRILNFGHTIGHALETLSEYRISHGEAVAMGIAYESYLSMFLGGLDMQAFGRIISLLRAYGFSLKLMQTVSFDALIEAMRMDKKAISLLPRFVLLDSIGQVSSFQGDFCVQVPCTLLQKAYDYFTCFSE